MSYGVTVRNPQGRILLSTEVEPFAFWKKLRGNSLVGEQTYELEVQAPAYPLAFVAPETGESASVVKTEEAGDVWRLYVVASSDRFEVYCFVPSRYVEATAAYGMRLYDSEGSVTYDSGKNPLVVRDARWVAPGDNFSFTDCRKPMVSLFPKGIRETQQTSWHFDKEIETEREYVCSLDDEGKYSCEWVKNTYSCTTRWALTKWRIYRPTFRPRSGVFGSLPWTQFGSGSFTHSYSTTCTHRGGPSLLPSYSDKPAHAGHFSRGEPPPYPNGQINSDEHLVLISDGAIYD